MTGPAESDFARGGYIAGHNGTDDVPIRLSPCETLICHDGTIRRNGAVIGHIDTTVDQAAAMGLTKAQASKLEAAYFPTAAKEQP